MKFDKVTVIDYGMGNLGSIASALRDLDAPFEIAATAAAIRDARKIILPGVGAFGKAMENLKSLDLITALEKRVVMDRTPFLGICLGMQLLADESDEGGNHRGLGWIKGRVQRLEPANLPVPHVGWNSSTIVQSADPLFRDIPDQADFYFDHSFYFRIADEKSATSRVKYGTPVVASVRRENIWGVQFHPEKSQFYGLRLLKNFLAFRGGESC